MKETILKKGEQLYIEFTEERLVGTIKGSSLVVSRGHQHVLRKWNAYGINAAAIESGEFKAVVVITESGKNLYTTVDEIKKHGHLSKEGDFELQYFMPIEQFSML